MYVTLITIHSAVRWLIVFVLITMLMKSARGWRRGLPYSHWDNLLRVIATALAHTQLIIGYLLYFKSPLTQFFMKYTSEAFQNREATFFGAYHIGVMTLSILVLSIGSAEIKRLKGARERHRKTFMYVAFSAFLIFLAIPWPGSPWVSRPYWRKF